MNKYKAFKIRFASKGYLRNDKNSHKLLGNAYYVLNDKNKIIKQFIQLDYATFRPTDIEMQKTSYYNNKKTINSIRKEILEKIQIDKGFDKNKISKFQKERLEIPKNELMVINKLLINQYKIKSSIDIFTGSNSSGCESMSSNTDIIAFENDNDFIENGMNFTNPLNDQEIFKKEKIDLRSINELEMIKLKDYIKWNPFVKEIISEYNYSRYFIFNDFNNKHIDFQKILEKINNENNLKSKGKSKRENKDFFINQIIKAIDEYSDYNALSDTKEDLEKAKKHKNGFFDKLRKYQKTLMEIEKSELIKKYKKPFNYFNDFVVGSESPNCEYAHIFPVKEIKKRDKSEWFKVADNNNCLLLNPSFHTALDKFQITINENGEFKSSQDDSIVIFKVKKEVLNNKRLEYIREFIDFSKTRR